MARVRTRPTREETIDQLLRGAADAFAQFGVLGAALEDICARANLTRGAFYSSFKTREELALALHARITNELIDEFRMRFDALPLVETAEEFSQSLLENLEYDRQIHVLFTEFHLLALRNEEFGRQMAQHNRRLYASLGASVSSAAGRSGFRFAMDDDLFARSLGALFFHGHLQALMDPEILGPGDLVKAVGPLMFNAAE
jgi:AcrR family transcriptional regulator